MKQWEILTTDDSSSSSPSKRMVDAKKRNFSERPPKPRLPVLFFDLNGDGRQETLIAFDKAIKLEFTTEATEEEKDRRKRTTTE